MVVIAGDAGMLGFGRRDASAELDRLYRRHADEVLRYVLAVMRSRADADDVVQTTFLRAFRALSRGERVQKPRNWLIKIAHNECRRTLALRSRRAVEVELADVPVEQAESGRAESLRVALSQLAPKQREALVLRELEGRTYHEIAARLAVSESAVETLIFRARHAVREQLENVLDCEAARRLIEQETLGEEPRRLLRAHTRACSACARAERSARGRRAALRRIASSLGLPGFCKTLLGKTVAVAVTASAVGVTGVAIAEQPAGRLPHPPPLRVDRPESAAGVPSSRHVAVAATAPRDARRPAPTARRPAAAPVPRATRPDRPVAAPKAPAPPEPAPVSPAAPAALAPAAEPPAPTPEPAVKPTSALPAPVSQLPTASLPAPDLPALPEAPVSLPVVDPPPLQVDLPVPVPQLPVATPQVPALPGVP